MSTCTTWEGLHVEVGTEEFGYEFSSSETQNNITQERFLVTEVSQTMERLKDRPGGL